MNVTDIMRSPLTRAGDTGPFLRLVLAEAAGYGMPPQVIATLDDVAAMLGCYDPLPAGQAAHLAGPLVLWQSHPQQPATGRIDEVEALAVKQRALIAFGGAPRDHMAGTAEIVCAMGNLHKAFMPAAYYEVFHWASADVLATLNGRTRAEMFKENDWAPVDDDEVVRPGGRLHAAYQEIATSIRRSAIAALDGQPEHPRSALCPFAGQVLRSHLRLRAELAGSGSAETLARIDAQIITLTRMFPDLDTDRVTAEGPPA